MSKDMEFRIELDQ
jgi:hypothetical protein